MRFKVAAVSVTRDAGAERRARARVCSINCFPVVVSSGCSVGADISASTINVRDGSAAIAVDLDRLCRPCTR
jgi:hypothetical protein